MRWHRLFDDLEAQWEAEARAADRSEVADRTRRERATVALTDRFGAQEGPVELLLIGGRRIEGLVEDVGLDFLTLAEGSWQRLVPVSAIVQVTGLTPYAAGAAAMTAARRFALGSALRAIARDRASVVVDDVLARRLTGTLDVVGADHVVLGEHALGQQRRRDAVVAARVLPFAALVCVSSGPIA